jgi:hypothetical protein
MTTEEIARQWFKVRNEVRDQLGVLSDRALSHEELVRKVAMAKRIKEVDAAKLVEKSLAPPVPKAKAYAPASEAAGLESPVETVARTTRSKAHKSWDV